MALTDTAARQAKPKEKAYTLADSLGLSLYIAPGGVKSWHFRFTWLGKQVRISFGTYPEVGLKDARARRDEAREEVAQGVDPRESRREKKEVLVEATERTFRRIYEEWISFRKKTISTSSYTVITNAMEHDALPALGHRHMEAIKRTDVIALIRKIENRGSITQAVKTRQWISQVFRYAIATGVIDSDPTVHMHTVTTKMEPHKHRAFMPFSEISSIVAKIWASDSSRPQKLATVLVILTAARPSEVRKAEWQEIDLDEAVWRIPGPKMKMRRDHVIPLSRQAVDILKEMLTYSAGHRFVFPHRSDPQKPIGINYAVSVIERCGLTGQQSPHGFRHMFSTEMNGREYNRDWVERQLAHGDTSVIRDIYNHATYLEHRRTMMQEWADLVMQKQPGA